MLTDGRMHIGTGLCVCERGHACAHAYLRQLTNTGPILPQRRPRRGLLDPRGCTCVRVRVREYACVCMNVCRLCTT